MGCLRFMRKHFFQKRTLPRVKTPAKDDRASQLWVLCHEQRRSKRRCVTVLEMKVGPSGSAIRSLIPSHRKLLWSKSMVVSVAEKSGR
jgi:hypothetical protein